MTIIFLWRTFKGSMKKLKRKSDGGRKDKNNK